MAIRWTLTRDQQRFESQLQGPLLRAIGLVALLGVAQIGLLCWKFFEGDPHWSYPILIAGFAATQAVLVSWIIYVNRRRGQFAGGKLSA